MGRRDGPNELANDEFGTVEELVSDRRFQLLSRRHEDQKPFSFLTMIPSRLSEIPPALADLLAKAKDEDASDENGDPAADDRHQLNPLDAIRQRGNRNLSKILSAIDEKIASGKNRLRRADVVVEDRIPDMRLIFGATFFGDLILKNSETSIN